MTTRFIKYIGLAAMACVGNIAMADNAGRLNISQLNIVRGEEAMTVNMVVNPKAFHIKSGEIVTLRPSLVNENDTLSMPAVTIAGHDARIALMRTISGNDNQPLVAGKGKPYQYTYTTDLPAEYNRSQLVVAADTSSVCNCRPARQGEMPVADLDFRPLRTDMAFRYVAPLDTAEKIFDLSGKANIIFKVNRTEIDWSYAGNQAELDTILRTINVVRDNPDATVQGIFLTGFASPEGSYANNVRLAKGRTEAVKDYVKAHSSFPASIYHTDYVPEDWEGLLTWLQHSNIPDRDKMIAFINDNTIPVAERNDIFRARFPEQYPYLLANVYPSLRHTDYKITYKVRKYYDIDEISRVMRTNPRNLSLNELFLLAGSYEQGSDEYDEVFTLAARLYPDSETANLNAANSAMNRRQYVEAERYLRRAGDSAQADYARGILAMANGDIDEAERLLTSALNAGISEAQQGLDEIERVRNFNGSIHLL
ncbi:MAG: OmpA family protein [Muribaculaceae bacterium]|nr:OmpA family protein [Muribaculaceae bacterium]